MEKLIEIGSVRKTHGYAGEIKLALIKGYGPDVKAAKFLFIGRIPAKALPYELESLRGADWIAKIAELTSKEQAAGLRGQNIYLREDEVTYVIEDEMEEETKASQQFVGFTIIDEHLGEVGMIEEVVVYPQQEIAKLTYKGQEALIPLNQALISGVDFIKKIVFMDLPEGLLDL